MKENISSAPSSELFRSRLFLFAGISGIIIGVGYIVITVLYSLAGFPLPEDAITWVSYLNGKFTLWWIIIWLSIITDILYVSFAYGIYELLKKSHPGLVLLSFSLFTLFMLLELSITWSRYPAILEIVSKYQASPDLELKSMYLASIEAISTEFQTVVTSFYMIFIPSLATIIASVALLKAKSVHRIIPFIGIISGSCNAISSIGGHFSKILDNLVVAGSFLALFWFFGIGLALVKYSIQLKQTFAYSESKSH